MKAKFDRPEIIDNITIALFLVMIVAMFIVCFSFENKLWMFLTAAVFLVIMYILLAFHGEIIAGEKSVVVIYTFGGKRVGKKFIAYKDIDRTECGVKTGGDRWGRVHYTMTFTIKMKGVSRITVFKSLVISANFPAEQPDKYKQYLHEQPLMQISHYIDSKLHLNTTV